MRDLIARCLTWIAGQCIAGIYKASGDQMPPAAEDIAAAFAFAEATSSDTEPGCREFVDNRGVVLMVPHAVEIPGLTDE